MKKYFKFLVIAFSIFFVACENNANNKTQAESTDSTSNLEVIKIGATPNPHARILENIKDDLRSDGIDLEIIEFSDYVLPNLSLNDGSIDANFHQHQPYLDKMVEDKKLKIESIAKVHIEPLGFYSKKYKSIDSIKNGATIAIPNDPSNGGRALILLHNNGIIKLKDSNNLYATELDIVENPKNIKIKQIEAAMLPKVFGDVDGAVINGNYALQAGLSAKDAIFLEDSRSPYANILVVRSSDINNPKILKLKERLLSPKTKQFIDEQYKGEIVSAF
ncbi:MetQ/NlpA family ABC transporter substrate-binding protein [Helicobacter sp. MIT 99-5507]|uniref:MetQ/NlpA family ABC transporter substrate-binding protein n=1 Tax=Helicobacter sp. MIT 99-5507 TaxID=152489 RepID=UPI000E1E53C9|nr:MetQ/NlpA family ABC transporter substrate-binding protein [Helicobacter sp. MIT 99-5507]RDU58413.1 methionine ABC transporter substrate-binding protein [Helicobacter sp. MIT 99-5507]